MHLCACWQWQYSTVRLCGQGSGAMSAHSMYKEQKQRKMRGNSITYDEEAQRYSESAYSRLRNHDPSLAGRRDRTRRYEGRMNMVESFETYRTYLFAIAYRMLGSAMDAEDMVQETYLRYQTTPPETIRSLKALLTTIISRLCMDQLHLARRQREQYLGPWLPEPILTAETFQVMNPEEQVDL